MVLLVFVSRCGSTTTYSWKKMHGHSCTICAKLVSARSATLRGKRQEPTYTLKRRVSTPGSQNAGNSLARSTYPSSYRTSGAGQPSTSASTSIPSRATFPTQTGSFGTHSMLTNPGLSTSRTGFRHSKVCIL